MSGQLRVLIIDDSQPMAFAIHRVLTKAGYQAAYALTMKEGLRLFEEQHPDIVLIDWVLPDSEGLVNKAGRFHENDAVIATAFGELASVDGTIDLRLRTLSRRAQHSHSGRYVDRLSMRVVLHGLLPAYRSAVAPSPAYVDDMQYFSRFSPGVRG